MIDFGLAWKEHLRPQLKRSVPSSVRRFVREGFRKAKIRAVALKDLDRELQRVVSAYKRGDQAGRDAAASFKVIRPAWEGALATGSPAFRDAQLQLYKTVSGRSQYVVTNEHSSFELERAKELPFPYDTGSPAVVGEQLLAQGFLLKNLPLKPPAHIVEFGPGWGSTTEHLLRLGFEVTAVEIDPKFAALVEHRGDFARERLSVHRGDMLTFDSAAQFDAALFFESFHHCADHLALLRNLKRLVRPGGVLLLASEPIYEEVRGWGVRLDGGSVWAMRQHGWLELGFTEKYLLDLLRENGWKVELLREPALGPIASLIIATNP